jgi:hypothetical protein
VLCAKGGDPRTISGSSITAPASLPRSGRGCVRGVHAAIRSETERKKLFIVNGLANIAQIERLCFTPRVRGIAYVSGGMKCLLAPKAARLFFWKRRSEWNGTATSFRSGRDRPVINISCPTRPCSISSSNVSDCALRAKSHPAM